MESVTPEDIRRFADRRAARDLEARRALHRRAAHDAGAIVEMIVREFNPERVVQWGSVLHPEHFREYSDIDIAVEGITDPGSFFELLAAAEEMARFPVDIVQLEHIEPEYRELILQKGTVVYER
ncbi:MAG: nucleotidyltransferase family protein [Spirochaetaceae bacterium]